MLSQPLIRSTATCRKCSEYRLFATRSFLFCKVCLILLSHFWGSLHLGCRANQEHLLILAVQTLSGAARQEKSHHRGGTYPHSHWLSLAKEPTQLQGSWRKLLRSHPLRRSQAVSREAAPTARAQGNSRAHGSCLSHRFPQLFSREKVDPRSRMAISYR